MLGLSKEEIVQASPLPESSSTTQTLASSPQGRAASELPPVPIPQLEHSPPENRSLWIG